LCFGSLKKTEYHYEQNNIISGLYYKPCMGVKVWAAQLIYSQTFYHCFINAIAVMSFKAPWEIIPYCSNFSSLERGDAVLPSPV